MTHICPIAGCGASVASGIFMCARHWRMVPTPLKAAVYASYQADRSRLSPNHREAVRIVERTEDGRAAPALPAGTKALTLWQPWASLIIIGAKPFEFRKWDFTDKPHLAKVVDKRIVIHAGARPPKRFELEDILARIDEGESALVGETARPFIERVIDGEIKLPMASAIGTGIIGRPRKSYDLFKHIVADSDRLDHQMYAWPVSEVQAFEQPVPGPGAQGFWNWN